MRKFLLSVVALCLCASVASAAPNLSVEDFLSVAHTPAFAGLGF